MNHLHVSALLQQREVSDEAANRAARVIASSVLERFVPRVWWRRLSALALRMRG